MNRKKFDEMRTEIDFLEDDIQDKHKLMADYENEDNIALVIDFEEIKDPDTFLTLSNFIDIQELKVLMKIEENKMRLRMW